jgi:hypothetical protein
MDARAIFLPDLAMVFLTVIVWLRMYVERIGQMRALRVSPQRVATSAQMAAALPDTRASDNFRNLFVVPVLFYLATVVAHLIGAVDPTTVVIAWVFVALRYVHSVIHVTYNRVRHRFTVYVLGCVVLWLLWGKLAIDLLR